MSLVSARGRLNIIRDTCPYGRLPWVCIAYVCIEAAILTPWNAIHRRLPGSGRRDTTVLPHVQSKVMGLAFSLFLLVKVSCLKLPPSGGVMSRWWLLVFTLGVCFSLVFSIPVYTTCLYYVAAFLSVSLCIISILVCIGHMVLFLVTLFNSWLYYRAVGTGIGYWAKYFN